MTVFGNTSNPSTLIIPTTTNYLTKTKYCNGCPYVEIRPLNKHNLYSNWFCAYHKLQGGTNNITLINFKVENGKFVETPSFCPKSKQKNLSPYERLKLWKKITPLTKFEDIEEGYLYHIPPINGQLRKDIVVVKKFLHTFEYKLYNSMDKSSYYIYSDDVAVNFMSKVKKIDL